MKQSINKKELGKLYKKNPNKYICDKLGISHPTLIVMLRQSNIPLKGKGNRNKRNKIDIIG